MPTPPSDQGGLPVFRSPTAEEELPPAPPSPPAPSTSPSPSLPPQDLPPPPSPPTSTTASSEEPDDRAPLPIEPDAGVAEALGVLATNAAQIGGLLANRIASRKAPSELWPQ